MTDQPGRPPEERLPAPRPPSEPVPAARFSAPPSAHRNDLTPERSAKIVRQSANARWVAFLAVTIVTLFVIAYYFYELGTPGGLTQSRLTTAADQQQVTAIERGYNVYQANCAQCHGVNGEGGKGPTLNRQDKLYAHLNPDYLNNMLQVGGRYACGDPNSIMPIWSNTGNPPGPLNYKQIQDLIAFIRAEQPAEFRVMDPSLFEPVIDPATGKEKTFEAWVDPKWTPAPGATPYPACWQTEFTTPASAAPSVAPSGSAAPSESAATGEIVQLAALNIQFDQTELFAPADTPFVIRFDNQEAVPHNVQIKDANGTAIFTGEIITGTRCPSWMRATTPSCARSTRT
jgi:mono/diheme cytochrome c family protein